MSGIPEYQVDITIRGFGGTLWPEVKLVVDAIKQVGGQVIVEDEHPPKDEITEEDILRVYGSGERKVLVKTVHLPWGA